MPDIPSKPWSVAVFERVRAHITDFCKDEIIRLIEDRRNRRIVIRAPVKSGKREIAEYLAMRDAVPRDALRVHAFISAWHRTADEEQREELRNQNMKVFSITKEKNANECIAWILAEVAKGHIVVIHLDEADHGSGKDQTMENVWKLIRSNPSIICILYTATPEEILFSGEVDEDPDYRELINEIHREAHFVEYAPPPGYCGPQRFLSEGLVHVALPFIQKQGGVITLSEQAKYIIRTMRDSIRTNPSRNIGVIRLSSSELGGTRAQRGENKSIHQLLKNVRSFPELEGVLLIADKGSLVGGRYPGVTIQQVEWSSRSYFDLMATGRLILIIHDQTSSRSTEWACHDRVHTTHDYRNSAHYGTISQAVERVNHYETKYEGGFQPIRVFAHKKTLMLSAGNIDYRTYMKDTWSMRKINRTELYRVKNTDTGNLHPDCPEAGISEEAAVRILQKLECYADIGLSARVAGTVRVVPKYKAVFKACDPDTWPAIRDEYAAEHNIQTRMRDPFSAAFEHRILNPDGTHMWQGQHRGWRVIDFQDGNLYQRSDGAKLDVGSTGGNRTKVCYQGGVLGVAFVRPDGTEPRDTLRASGSMYGEVEN
jgi:hypothetical protein